ncbi:hypothetical protein DSO57_1015710 [Entomophthora muscae]|uniref:Uncharacterized protein n=1 Tax=Entomophthora muscae TaxID=34485 RepID=A0ACC2RW46_9FUNG|nr:hypothetical protein DSO57_1015710 [Entomophthora muscae]
MIPPKDMGSRPTQDCSIRLLDGTWVTSLDVYFHPCPTLPPLEGLSEQLFQPCVDCIPVNGSTGMRAGLCRPSLLSHIFLVLLHFVLGMCCLAFGVRWVVMSDWMTMGIGAWV